MAKKYNTDNIFNAIDSAIGKKTTPSAVATSRKSSGILNAIDNAVTLSTQPPQPTEIFGPPSNPNPPKQPNVLDKLVGLAKKVPGNPIWGMDAISRPSQAVSTFLNEEQTSNKGDLERFKDSVKKGFKAGTTSIYDDAGQKANVKTMSDLITSNPILNKVAGKDDNKPFYNPKNLLHGAVSILGDPTNAIPIGEGAALVSKFAKGRKLAPIVETAAKEVKPITKALPSAERLMLPEPAIQMGPKSILPTTIDRKFTAPNFEYAPKVKPSTINNKLTLENTPLIKSKQAYEDAIQTIQNHFGTDQLRSNEFNQIKPKLGIDIPDLIKNYELAEKTTPTNLLNSLRNKSRMRTVSGAATDNVYNMLDRVTSTPKSPLSKLNPNMESKSILAKRFNQISEAQKPLLPNIKAKSPFEVNPQFKVETPRKVLPGELPGRLKPIELPKAGENPAILTPKVPNAKTLTPETTLGDNMKNWKDKSMLSLKRETLERNFEDVAGKDAPKMIDTYVNPIHVNEAEATRFKNAERETIKSLGIKYGSKEDELVQKFGEGKITLEELKIEAPKTWEQVVNATETFRSKYDAYLEKINEVITRNGYDPIPKRANYFPHMAETESILKQFGMGLDNLPTDITGLTADFKPGKNFFVNALRRKGDRTKFSAIEGFDKYIEGASKLIYHTDDIKRLRGLEKSIREEFAETNHLSNFVTDLLDYTNNLAGKKSKLDRGAEELVGRNIYGFVDKIRQQISSNMIGANIGSALTNFIPLTHSLATTEKIPFIKGMIETMGNVLKDDGFINKSHFLTRRMGSNRLALGNVDKVVDKAFTPFKIVDKFVSQVIVRSKYLEGLKNGLTEQQALKQADDWAVRIMADRSLGSTPTLFNSKTMSPFTQFQIEVNNQLSFMFKDMPRKLNRTKLASSAVQLAVYSYLFNNLYEKVLGRRPAFDIIGVVLNAKEDFSKPDKKLATKNLAKNISNQLPFIGMVTGGRLPMEAGIPSISKLLSGESTVSKELMKPLIYLSSPTGGGQGKKVYDGIKTLSKQGVYGSGKDGEYLKYPVENTTTNKVKAPLFGISSLQETQDYYNNNQRSLSSGQTQKFNNEVKKGKDPKMLYNSLLEKRKLDNRLTEIKNNASLSKLQKIRETSTVQRKLKDPKLKWLNQK